MNIKRKLSIGLIVFTMIGGSITTYATPVDSIVTINENETRASLEEKISILDNEIETTLLEIEKLETSKKENQENLESLIKEIEETKIKKDKQEEAFGKRAAVLYKEGFYNNGGKLFFYLKVITSTTTEERNVLEFLNNIEDVKRILKYDNDLLNDLKKSLKTIEDNKIKANKIEEQLKTQEQSITEKQSKLESKKAEVLEKLNDEILRETQEQAEQAQRAMEAQLALQVQREVQVTMQAQRELPASMTTTYDNVKPEGKSSETSSQVVSESYKYLGTPYLWGGTTPSGFDCSGYMQYIFRKQGVNLPRVARAQQNVGVTISRGQIQPGDLVFFGNPAHHVGMYIGNGNYIHSPRTGDVIKISPLSSRAPSTIKRVL